MSLLIANKLKLTKLCKYFRDFHDPRHNNYRQLTALRCFLGESTSLWLSS